MRSTLFSLGFVLAWLSDCVLADRDAIGNEILTFYYIYKMQYTSGGLITTGGALCKTAKPICQFDEYVVDVMAYAFAAEYKPAAGDHTLTPSEDGGNLRAFNAVVDNARQHTPPIPIQYQLSAIIGDGKASGPQVVQRMMGLARRAWKTDGVATSDIQAALDNAHRALAARFLNAKGDFDTALRSAVSSDAIAYLKSDSLGWYDWRASLKSIDDAHDAGRMDAATRANYKNEIRQFARAIRAPGGSPESTRVHLDLLQKYQSAVTRLSRWVSIRTGEARSGGC